MTSVPELSGSDEHDLTHQQEEFCKLFYAGDDPIRGNQTRAYMEAYYGRQYEPNSPKYNQAASAASTLIRKEKVRARIAEIREECAEEAKKRARDWWELYPEAQQTLMRAARGELSGDEQDKRSAVEAAKEIVARCLGSVKIQHEHQVKGQAIVAHVAGPNVDLEELEAGREVEADGEALPSPGPRIEDAG